MNLLNKLTIKNLKLNQKRTIVTIIGIMLSVALITAVAAMYSSAIKSLISFEVHEKGNFHVAYYNVPLENIKDFENNRNIEQINITKDVGYAKIDSKNEYKPYACIKAFTKDALNNLSVKLEEGRLPENENEIVIPTHLQTNGRVFLKIGDNITLNVGKRIDKDGDELKQQNPVNYDDAEGKVLSEAIVDTTEKTFKIVGIIERPATNVESYTAPGYTFITYTDESELKGNVDVYARYQKKTLKNCYRTTANILGVDEEIFEKISRQEEYTKEEMQKYIEEMNNAKYDMDANSYLINLETNPISESGIAGLGVVVGIVIGIIVFTSIFCIKNSFDISITEKTKQYGMLRSIGATKKQIKRNVFYEATILGIIGIPLGIILGFIATFILIIISNYYIGDAITSGLKLEFSFSAIAVLVAILLGIVTIYFSAFRSARRASKVSPIDSIRNSANIKINPKKIKSPKIIKKIFGSGGEISFKNLKRNKKKYRTTVISVIVSVAVFIALYSFMGMAFDTVEDEVKLSEFNIILSTRSINGLDNEKYNRYIDTTKLNNIENYSILRQDGFNCDSKKLNPEYIKWVDLSAEDEEAIEPYFSVYALGNYQYEKYIKSLGLNYNEIKDKAILIDYQKVGRLDEKDKNQYKYKTMRIFDYKIGEKMNGSVHGEKTCTIDVGYITDVKPFGLKNIDQELIIVSDELFEKIATLKMSKAVEIVYKSDNPNELQNDIEEALKGEEYYLTNLGENVEIMNNLFTLIGIFLYGFIIVISLIGITNIFNTITTNMELRKQEFAMLKSVGMTTKEFNKMIRLESLFMGVKALFFGIPVGLILSYTMYHFLQGTGIPYKLPIMAILISVLVVFLLISLIMKYSINKINKQNTIETIRNENI